MRRCVGIIRVSTVDGVALQSSKVLSLNYFPSIHIVSNGTKLVCHSTKQAHSSFSPSAPGSVQMYDSMSPILQTWYASFQWMLLLVALTCIVGKIAHNSVGSSLQGGQDLLARAHRDPEGLQVFLVHASQRLKVNLHHKFAQAYIDETSERKL